jgi:gliding motility-associated-like protein
MRIIKHLIFFIILLINVTCFAQKQANIWHFGNGRSLDFSSGAPVNVTGSQIFTYEGCASYCDKYGNFLFYTNGGGEAFGVETGRIWNRNNAVMYDMLGIEGGGISSAQSSVIFEAPGQDSVYYVFTMEDLENQSPNRGLAYFTVDMRLNAGLGAVVLSNVQVHSPSVEGLCAIKHANGQDYWVIIYQDSIGLGVYSVTQTGGVSLAGTFTGAGTTLPIPSGLQVIKASPNGQYLVALFDNINNGEKEPFLLRFNNATGQISLPIRISTTTSLGSITSYEFSPNSKFLYTLQIDTLTPFPIPQSVVKFNIQAPNINSSASVIYNTSISSLLCGLQTGPDGKIYFIDGYGGDSKINRIVCPNTSASVELNLFNYPNSSFNAFPNFPAWLFENYDSTSINVSLGPDTIRLCDVGGSYVLNAQNPGASYLWSTGATTQSITVNTPGIYSVTVSGTCGTGTDRVVVVSCGPPTITGFNIVGDTCNVATNFSFQPIGTTNATSLTWTFDDPNSGANTYVSTPANPNAPHIFSAAGTYNICLTFQEPGFPVTTICKTVHIGQCCNAMILTNGNCLQNSIPFSITTGATVSSVNWNFDDPPSGANNTSTSLTPTHLFSASGTYNIRAIVNLSCGVDTISKTLSIIKCDSVVAECQLFVPSAFTPNNDGKNDKFNPQTICPTEQFECLIYSRWGELIFKTSKQTDKWDGKYKGADCSTGVYVYLIRYKLSRQQPKNAKGTITLLR